MIAQLCPSDYPPFAELCLAYEKALHMAGERCFTVILQAPSAQPVQGFAYLGAKDLRATGKLVAGVRDLLAESPRLTICHRYRAASVARRLGLERLIVAHEFGYFARWRRRLAARIERHATYAGVSPPVCDELAAVVKGVALLPNVLDLEALDAHWLPREEARRQLGLPAQGAVVGWVGRLHAKKRPDLAARAIEAMGVDATLAVLGEGPLQLESPRLHRCGFVADARRYFKAFDVLLLTAANIEAFGMTALEAMAAEVPVVCSRAPGPGYVLGSSGTCYDDDTPVAVARALTDALSAPVDGSARARVEEEFSVPALARRLGQQLQQQLLLARG